MSEVRYAVVIEDELDASELIELVLTQSGFTVVTALDGVAGIAAVREYDPLLTTLDVQMPGMDGFAVAKRLREFSLTYLIFLTGMDSEIDVIQGFEAGADDYLVKPFRPRELRARADAMLRRMRLGAPTQSPAVPVAPKPEPESWAAAAARELRKNPLAPTNAAPVAPQAAVPARPAHTPPAPVPILPNEPSGDSTGGGGTANGLLEHAGVTLDSQNGRISYLGRALDLTPGEFALLSTLLGTGRRVRSKADLTLTLRGQDGDSARFVNEADKRQVDSHIASLRQKLGDDSDHPRVIETVRGVGYRLAAAS